MTFHALRLLKTPWLRKEHTDDPVSRADVQCSVLPGATGGRLSVVRKCSCDLTNTPVITNM